MMISIVKAHGSTGLLAQCPAVTEVRSRPRETRLKVGLIKLHTSCSHTYCLNFYCTLQPNVQLVQAWEYSQHGPNPMWLIFRIVTEGVRWSQQRESLMHVFSVKRKKNNKTKGKLNILLSLSSADLLLCAAQVMIKWHFPRGAKDTPASKSLPVLFVRITAVQYFALLCQLAPIILLSHSLSHKQNEASLCCLMLPQSEASHQEPKSSSLNRKDPSSRGIEHSAEEHWAAQRRVAAWKSSLRRPHQQTAMSEPLTFASEEAPSKTYWHAHRPPVAHCCLSAVSRYRRTFDKSQCLHFVYIIYFISSASRAWAHWLVDRVSGRQWEAIRRCTWHITE